MNVSSIFWLSVPTAMGNILDFKYTYFIRVLTITHYYYITYV